jgi:hypothetical protein
VAPGPVRIFRLSRKKASAGVIDGIKKLPSRCEVTGPGGGRAMLAGKQGRADALWPGRSPSSVRATTGDVASEKLSFLPDVWHPAATEAVGVLKASPSRRQQASGQGCG